jgi:hypothetical protein
MESVLNVTISCFEHYRESKKPKSVNLIDWLTSEKYRVKVEEIRILEDKAKRDEVKATLPAITPSGIFSQRRESGLIQHSGLIQIDLDRQDNLHILNWDDLKPELIKLPEIAYLGKSVSGTGYWGLIPIPADPLKHKLYFDAIYDSFLSWHLYLDTKPKNIASLRGYSFDPDGYFNHYAALFQKTMRNEQKQFQKSDQGKEPDMLLSWLVTKMNSAQSGERHSTRLSVGRLLGGYIASGILPRYSEDFLIQNYLDNFATIDSLLVQRKEINAIKNGVKHGLNFPIC